MPTAPLLLFLCNERITTGEVLVDKRLILGWNSLLYLFPFIFWHP
jgi:hypothetical protein